MTMMFLICFLVLLLLFNIPSSADEYEKLVPSTSADRLPEEEMFNSGTIILTNQFYHQDYRLLRRNHSFAI